MTLHNTTETEPHAWDAGALADESQEESGYNLAASFENPVVLMAYYPSEPPRSDRRLVTGLHAVRHGLVLGYGGVLMSGSIVEPVTTERFLAKVAAPNENGCHLWTGALTHKGYGQIAVRRRTRLAHRYAYELAFGVIPDDLQVDHTCWTPACVNPGHLRLVTRAQNGQNRSGSAKHSASGIRGVFWNERIQRWGTRAYQGDRVYYGGHFKDINDAEQAAIALRNRLFTHNDADRIPTNPHE